VAESIDVYHAARTYIERHGEAAAIYAAMRADEMLNKVIWKAEWFGSMSSKSSRICCLRNQPGRCTDCETTARNTARAPIYVGRPAAELIRLEVG
jgi:hypothetical protein